MPKKGSPAAIAYLEQRIAYFRDPTQAPHEDPPKPPSAEVAYEIVVAGAQISAILLDYKLTGEMHPDNPCPEAILAAGEMMDKALDGELTYSDCEDVARRFGWKGESDAGT